MKLASQHTVYVLLTLLICFSRSFAKIGFGGVYITELFILLVLAPRILGNPTNRRSGCELILLALVAYHTLLIIIIDLGRYPVSEVIRDSTIWLYPVAALYMARLDVVEIEALFKTARKIIGIWLYIYPVYFVYKFILAVPYMDDIIIIKKQDASIAIALYMLLSLHEKRISIHHLLLVIISAILVSTQGRASLLVILITLVYVAYDFRATIYDGLRRYKKTVTLLVLLLVVLQGVSIETDFRAGRAISFAQISENLISIFTDSDDASSNVENTELFRLIWWAAIIDDAFSGGNLTYGFGYGLNLAKQYGFQKPGEESLRSPHNIVLNILARSGILITTFLLVYLSVIIVKGFYLEKKYRILNVLVVLMIVHGLFDVYLEGPMGAFPFWVFIGILFSKFKDVRAVNKSGK